MKKLYITTPIYYVNAKPHIGHAYTTIVCDFYARLNRALGVDVKFMTGTDEHGKKIEQSAKNSGVPTQEFVDEISMLFRNLLPILNISNDDFIRTTEERHKKAVAKLWQTLMENDYIYLGEYSGWYDIRNEAYFSKDELVDGKSPLGGEVQFMTEPCYFFRLSAFSERLLEFYESNPDFIFPEQRRNEVISFVSSGLKDLAISRTTFEWGIPVPSNPNHVVYVWLDALTNYLTVNGYPDNIDQNSDEFWQNSIHFVGKEIVRFHAVYWPAFLMAARINPPKQIVAHGWWLSEGEKMSKSLGNVQDPVKYANLFGSDALRYFVLRELSFGSDGNFSLEGFINRYNSFLANSFGNLVNRVLSFVKKYCDGVLTVPESHTFEDSAFFDEVSVRLSEALEFASQYAFSRYLEKIEQAVAVANQYVDHQKPWSLKDSNQPRMMAILFFLVESIYKLANFLAPVIPLAAEKLLVQLNLQHLKHMDPSKRLVCAIQIGDVEVLFPKIDTTEMEKFDVFARE